ncbi:MAG: glycosyltransferase [Chloroflexota bacterium]
MIRTAITTFGIIQALLAARVLLRLLRTAGGQTIERSQPDPSAGAVSVIVPVLNEVDRLAPCLDGLTRQGDEVAEILVVDGGSTDGTQHLIEQYAGRDRRLRLINAHPIPGGWNGKAWGLHAGFEQSNPDIPWVLTIDADVRPAPGLVASLTAHATRNELDALSVATKQQIDGLGEGLLHPAMLTTLVYRFGIPGNHFESPSAVQANGQCFLARRDLVEQVGGFEQVRGSICEDITLARALVIEGATVGFYEAPGLVAVDMYDDWQSTWREWPRSLPMRDRYWGVAGPIGLLEVALVQAAPGALLGAAALAPGNVVPSWLVKLNLLLLITRLGALAGTSRAYSRRPRSYWMSPLADLPVAITIIRHAFRRQYIWRGRALVRGG